jgi:hypothetical protein
MSRERYLIICNILAPKVFKVYPQAVDFFILLGFVLMVFLYDSFFSKIETKNLSLAGEA